MKGRRKKDKDTRYESKKVVLHTLTRHIVDPDTGEFEYHDVVSDPMPYKDLPKEALPMTGTKDSFVLVDMEPVLPDYCKELEFDRNGRPKPHNWFDAQGYYIYAIDNRIKEAEQAATATMKPIRDIDWKKVVTVAACVVVVALVVWRFVS